MEKFKFKELDFERYEEVGHIAKYDLVIKGLPCRAHVVCGMTSQSKPCEYLKDPFKYNSYELSFFSGDNLVTHILVDTDDLEEISKLCREAVSQTRDRVNKDAPPKKKTLREENFHK